MPPIYVIDHHAFERRIDLSRRSPARPESSPPLTEATHAYLRELLARERTRLEARLAKRPDPTAARARSMPHASR